MSDTNVPEPIDDPFAQAWTESAALSNHEAEEQGQDTAEVEDAFEGDLADLFDDVTVDEPVTPPAAPVKKTHLWPGSDPNTAVAPPIVQNLRPSDIHTQREREARYVEAERLAPYVQRLGMYAGTNTALVDLARSFELTRDPIKDRDQRKQLADVMTDQLSKSGAEGTKLSPPSSDLALVLDILYDDLLGIGPLGPLWRDDTVTEIIVRGPKQVWVERVGQGLSKDIATFRTLEELRRLARNLAGKVSNRALSQTNPLVTAELPGARVQFAYEPVTKDQVLIAIRKFRPLMDMRGLLAVNALTPEMVDFLSDCVRARATILVSGGTGTGKTTMINALSAYIPDGEHVVTIEDSYELTLANANVTSLQSKERSSADDVIVITLADLLVATLRLRPDRIIVGEIREGAAASVMLQAASTGHDGSMTTVHASNVDIALNERIPDMLLEHKHVPLSVARRTVASSLDIVVQVTRKRNLRFISDISLVDRRFTDADGVITPVCIFNGDFSDGKVVFQRVGVLGADTDIATRMSDVGVDATRWEKTP